MLVVEREIKMPLYWPYGESGMYTFSYNEYFLVCVCVDKKMTNMIVFPLLPLIVLYDLTINFFLTGW